MSILGFFEASLVGGFATSMTDWFFTGVLFHEKYRAYPEVWWRTADKSGENRAVAIGAVIGLVAAAVFVAGASALGLTSLAAALGLALLMWLSAALPILVSWALFAKIHPLVIVAHAAGWLVRLALLGVAVAYFC